MSTQSNKRGRPRGRAAGKSKRGEPTRAQRKQGVDGLNESRAVRRRGKGEGGESTGKRPRRRAGGKPRDEPAGGSGRARAEDVWKMSVRQQAGKGL